MSTANGSMPRVSTVLRILDDAYADVPNGVLDIARERGEALHRLCLSYLAFKSDLCQEPMHIPDEYGEAYRAFVLWVAVNEVEVVAIEQPSSSTKHGFSGTPDALIMCGPQRLLTILDLKFTASILRTNKVQVQAYWRLDLYQDAKRVMLLHIKPLTGEIKPHTITKNPHDWAAFMNALSVWRWRQG